MVTVAWMLLRRRHDLKILQSDLGNDERSCCTPGDAIPTVDYGRSNTTHSGRIIQVIIHRLSI